MEITSLNRIAAAGSRNPEQSELDRNDALRNAHTTVRTLNSRNIPDREFAIVRDPASHRFVVQVLDRTTGDVIDQFPPEDILKFLSQFDPTQDKHE
jgi:uncharacterized FlaG/YvyC family protein